MEVDERYYTFRIIETDGTDRFNCGEHYSFDKAFKELRGRTPKKGWWSFIECVDAHGRVHGYRGDGTIVRSTQERIEHEAQEKQEKDEMTQLSKTSQNTGRFKYMTPIQHAINREIRIQELRGFHISDELASDEDWQMLIEKYLNRAVNEEAYENIVKMLAIGFAWAAVLLNQDEEVRK